MDKDQIIELLLETTTLKRITRSGWLMHGVPNVESVAENSFGVAFVALLEMMIQCLHYERAGSRGLDEFWEATDQYEWHYALSAVLYGRLKGMRPS